MESTGEGSADPRLRKLFEGMPVLVPAYPEHTPYDHLVVLAAVLVLLLVMLALLPASDP